MTLLVTTGPQAPSLNSNRLKLVPLLGPKLLTRLTPEDRPTAGFTVRRGKIFAWPLTTYGPFSKAEGINLRPKFNPLVNCLGIGRLKLMANIRQLPLFPIPTAQLKIKLGQSTGPKFVTRPVELGQSNAIWTLPLVLLIIWSSTPGNFRYRFRETLKCILLPVVSWLLPKIRASFFRRFLGQMLSNITIPVLLPLKHFDGPTSKLRVRSFT